MPDSIQNSLIICISWLGGVVGCLGQLFTAQCPCVGLGLALGPLYHPLAPGHHEILSDSVLVPVGSYVMAAKSHGRSCSPLFAIRLVFPVSAESHL